jgi:His/Glu/Gln/Arg/opine family amino acid ABC transporter permease subunit
MECWDTITDYAFRSLGYGPRLLPRSDFTLCQQITLIGSGMIWNIYFGVVALSMGFVLAVGVAVGKAAHSPYIRKPSEWFIFVFRGSPLFIQFFFAYFLFLALKRAYPFLDAFSSAWLGALMVLFLNTAAYSGEIFHGALKSIPKGDIEAADAYGMSGLPKFRRITFPTMLRLAWPAYTNEAIFLFHATTLVFVSGFPAKQQGGDALYYASYFADKTFNPFIPYPILAGYFILLTLVVIGLMGVINRRLNRHLAQAPRLRVRPNLIR